MAWRRVSVDLATVPPVIGRAAAEEPFPRRKITLFKHFAGLQVRFEPLHYLALLEKKPGALDHARPLAGWILPDCFGVLRRRLENERAGDGTREYIRVLRLLEKHSLSQLRQAVEQALAVGAISRDAIAQFLFPRPDWRFTAFSLDGHPHLRHVHVAAPDIGEYRQLLAVGA